MFSIVLSNLIMLLVCMIAGFIARKVKLIDDRTASGLSDILVKVTLPCLIFMSLQKPFSTELLVQSIIVIIIGFIMHLACMLFGFFLVKLFKVEINSKGVWIFACTFGNIGYMGFPIISSVYGQDALFFTSLTNTVYNFLCFTLGIYLINLGYNKKIKISVVNIIKHPTIIATVIGFVFFVLGIGIYEPVGNGLASLGSITTPLSMLVVGSILAKTKVKETISDWTVYLISFVRLLVFPVIMFFALRNFINDDLLGIYVILSGMPVAAMTAILSAQYETNYILASRFVFVSTVLCIITVPIISLLL